MISDSKQLEMQDSTPPNEPCMKNSSCELYQSKNWNENLRHGPSDWQL